MFFQCLPHSALQPSDKFSAKGVSERGMGNDGRSLEEARRTDTFRTVDYLGRENEVPGCNLFAERANCREGEDCLHTEMFESRDICSRWNITRGDGMAFAVTGQESDLCARWQRADGYWRAREAPGLERKKKGDWDDR